MVAGLRVDASVLIPEDELRWELPADPAVGRADPTLGGFCTVLTVDTTACAALDARQRQRIRERVARFRRSGDVVVANVDGVITVTVDWIVGPPESGHLAREHLAAVLRDAL
ncbi:hypothetical protein AA958_08635 [Streptomyces sp. CNQ-509]|uniref:hypothetical protein n=1 Tax=unclassified Streptomyces TaxID=2593676 RepID=UPI00062E0739|nr:hypothetical protein [Streptomyces sp. CNQ-509]AKH82287.1 hypothetical protein AA958_08635 [Streptomyces sp. CNQ-509]